MSEKEIYKRINDIDSKHDNNHKDTLMRLESYHAHIMEIVTTGAVLSERLKQIKAQMENLPQPESRPCDELKNHIQEHKESHTLWQRPFISGIVGGLFALIVLFARGLWEWAKRRL